ncbi:MAG: hypothetical protein J0H32_17140, partial [Rhizobiales bacterium]|nr:hypothetical protein [Hyphomicrobiales bacterium]
SFQGHPEFQSDYSQAILELRKHIFSEPVFQSGIDSLARPHQGTAVGEWMMRFVQQGSDAKKKAEKAR